MIEIEDLLGIPFKVHGRDKSGYDCYGLVIEIAGRLGHKMPDLYYGYDYSEENNEKTLSENSFNIISAGRLMKTDSPAEGDIVLFKDRKGRTCHIGVYLGKDRFIHCDSAGVRITRLSEYNRKGEAYRWQN